MIKVNFKESTEWRTDKGYNMAFLREAEKLLNSMIRRGYIYENEMYQTIGILWDPSRENRLFLQRKNAYEIYPGRFVLEYFPGSEMLVIHNSAEEES